MLFSACRSVQTSTTILNANDIRFEAPVAHELSHNQHAYYLQNIKFQGKDLLLTTDWFDSTGVKESFEWKKEIQTSLSPDVVNLIRKIEDFAINGGLVLPKEFESQLGNADIFKRLPANGPLHVRVHHNAQFFDQNCVLKKAQDMGFGKYRAIIHVKAIYIGHTTSKVAQLQLRVMQLQHIPQVPCCLFAPVSKAEENRVPQNQSTDSVKPDVSQTTLKKGSRKPKLQRQNTTIDGTVPSEFFNDENTMGSN